MGTQSSITGMNNKRECCWVEGGGASDGSWAPRSSAECQQFTKGLTHNWMVQKCGFIYTARPENRLSQHCQNPAEIHLPRLGRPPVISINSNPNKALLQPGVLIPVQDVLKHMVPRAEDQRERCKLPSSKNDHFLGLFLIDSSCPPTPGLSRISQLGVATWHPRVTVSLHTDPMEGWRDSCVSCFQSCLTVTPVRPPPGPCCVLVTLSRLLKSENLGALWVSTTHLPS